MLSTWWHFTRADAWGPGFKTPPNGRMQHKSSPLLRGARLSAIAWLCFIYPWVPSAWCLENTQNEFAGKWRGLENEGAVPTGFQDSTLTQPCGHIRGHIRAASESSSEAGPGGQPGGIRSRNTCRITGLREWRWTLGKWPETQVRGKKKVDGQVSAHPWQSEGKQATSITSFLLQSPFVCPTLSPSTFLTCTDRNWGNES